MASYLEILLNELSQYKKTEEISPVVLLNYAFDIYHFDDNLDKTVLARLNWIKDNSTADLLLPLSVLEHIYSKNKGSKSTAEEIIYRDNKKRFKSVFLSAIIKGRQDAIIEINGLTNKILRKFDYSPSIRPDDNGRSDYAEIGGLRELERAKKKIRIKG